MSPLMEADDGTLHDSLTLALTPDEVRLLAAALADWMEDQPADPEWHTHLDDTFGRSLTVGVMPSDDPRFAAGFSDT